ncbi:MAG: S26 family signal peptidase [Alphaproteobacteria bacterium]|nr:S26 family signal peptidase [Alphaproteobacteria bacterium]
MRKIFINPFWIKSLVLGGMAFSLVWIVASHTKIHFNRTDSAPYRAFICADFVRIGLGDYVSVEGHQADYFSGLHYTKMIAGIPGDVITIKDGGAFIGSRFIGTLLNETTQGLTLTPLDIKKIPAGYVFVVGNHSRSFDSRYQEFGLVKASHIRGRCFGIGKRKVEQA